MSGLCVTYAALATRRLGLPHFKIWSCSRPSYNAVWASARAMAPPASRAVAADLGIENLTARLPTQPRGESLQLRDELHAEVAKLGWRVLDMPCRKIADCATNCCPTLRTIAFARLTNCYAKPGTSRAIGHPGPLSSGPPRTAAQGNRSNVQGSPWM